MEPIAWLLQIGHACLWGSLAIAAVGAACRCLPRLPASVRAWLWWVACAKLLLDIYLVSPINLPLLPAPTLAVRPTTAAAVPYSPAAPATPQRVSAAAPAAAEAEPTAACAPLTPRWPLLLFAVWIAGAAAFFAFTVRQSFAMKRLQRGVSPAVLPDIDLDAIARQMGLKCTPRVLTGPYVQTPCVSGWLRPVILLPLNVSGTLTPTELRLTLAHEVAHLKRLDLPLAVVPLLARTVFFFHPLVWWASAEWAAAREEACDALALSATRLPPADYGRLLLKLASPTASPPALGISPGYHTLRRRLVSLSSPRLAPSRARLLMLALPLLLPWRLSAALSPASLNPNKMPTYSVIALAGDADSEVTALNNAGQVALSVRAGDDTQGYAGRADTLTALDALPKHHASLVYGLSDAGQAAGASFNIPGHARAFVWDGVTHKIGSLPGYPYSEARGINSAGEIAGFSETGHANRRRAWVTRAFLHRPGEPLTDLGTLGGQYSAAYAVNSSGTVVGKADTEEVGATHAFAWTDGQMTDLGTLGGANSVAYAVGDTGQITGASDADAAGTRHAFLYADNQMQDLAPLPGMATSAAYALNSAGQVAGTSQTLILKRATLWQSGQPTDLNTLLPPHSGWVLTEAHAVNDHGQIAGVGLFGGHRRAFLLTPR